MPDEDPKKVAIVIKEDRKTGIKEKTKQVLDDPSKFYKIPLEKGVIIQRSW